MILNTKVQYTLPLWCLKTVNVSKLEVIWFSKYLGTYMNRLHHEHIMGMLWTKKISQVILGSTCDHGTWWDIMETFEFSLTFRKLMKTYGTYELSCNLLRGFMKCFEIKLITRHLEICYDCAMTTSCPKHDILWTATDNK